MKLSAPQQRALCSAREQRPGIWTVRVSYPQTIDALERLGLVEQVGVFRTGHSGRLTELGLTERKRVLLERGKW